MKKTIYILFLLLITLFFSCSRDSIEGLTEEKAVAIEESENTATIPCDFNLSNVKEGETLTIDCILDLEGKEINLPKNVTLAFNKGDIKNGTLNFTEEGKIDGRLLNASLKIEGNAQLIKSTFTFIPSRWENIIQGETNFDTALKNTAEFEKLMFHIQTLGGTTFEINKFDAYFEVTTVTSTTSDQNYRDSEEAVNLPSNFHLKMTDETFLRMFPSAPEKTNGFILAVKDVENVTVTGGNLIGDVLLRKFNTQNPGGTGSLLFGIHSGRNINFNNVHLENGSAGAITIYSLGFPFNSDYKPSTGIKITNCTFKNNRRMAISLTDGRDVIIEGNTFENSGQPNANIDGGEVGYAVNLEPYKEQDVNGNVTEFQKVFNVNINSNIEKNSRIGFLTISSSKDIIVENNTVETRIAYSFSSNVIVRKNILTASTTTPQHFAIFCAGGLSLNNFDNKVYENIIAGYGTGIALEARKIAVYKNTINNSEVGIQLTNSKEVDIYENPINVSNIGIIANLTAIDKINIYKNTIQANGFHITLSQINQKPEEKEYTISIKENDFTEQRPISLFYANGVTIELNNISGGINIENTSNSTIASNTIIPNERDGAYLSGDNTNILLNNNTITKPTSSNYKCIDNDSTSPNNIILTNNTCN